MLNSLKLLNLVDIRGQRKPNFQNQLCLVLESVVGRSLDGRCQLYSVWIIKSILETEDNKVDSFAGFFFRSIKSILDKGNESTVIAVLNFASQLMEKSGRHFRVFQTVRQFHFSSNYINSLHFAFNLNRLFDKLG